MAHKVIVIGGANTDIAGLPSSELIPRDSNIGKISISPGGVGRNIAVNLSRLGVDVHFITAIGDDVFSQTICRDCSDNKIDITMSKTVKGGRSSVYMYIADETGDMYAAVNDMDIINEITPEYLSQFDLNDCDACCVDANLSRQTLEYICSNTAVPVYADPVSCTKAVRLKGLHLAAVKPNLAESSILFPYDADRTYISLGSEGIKAVDSSGEYFIPSVPVPGKDTNGCGDAATAAIIFSELSGNDIKSTAEFAVDYISDILSNR